MKTSSIESSSALQPGGAGGAGGAGLGVAGVSIDFGTFNSSLSSPSTTARTPRWGTIRQRFSSIQSRDNPSLAEDGIDDAMWDKNDAAFLEEVARDSPLLLRSPHRFDSPAMTLDDNLASPTSLSSSRPNSSLLSKIEVASPSASNTSICSTPIASHEPLPAVPAASFGSFGPARPWPRSMRKTPSATLLPDLPEQSRIGDAITYPRPSTSSSSNASMPPPPPPPPLLPSIASPSSFMASGFSNHNANQSASSTGSPHSSLGSSAMLAHSLHIPSDSVRSANLQDQYPRSPSLHSSSSFTNPSYVLRPLDDRTANANARQRTISSNSAISSAWTTPSFSSIDHRPNRAQISSPLAPTIASLSSLPSSPEVIFGHHFEPASPILTRLAAENNFATANINQARLSIASKSGSPVIPCSPCSQTASLAASSTNTSDPPANQPSALVRKHTKNRSSLVSGLRKLMGKREKEGKPASANLADDAPTPLSLPLSSQAAAPTASLTSPETHPNNNAVPSRAELDLLGLAPDAFESDATLQALHDSSNSRVANLATRPDASPIPCGNFLAAPFDSDQGQSIAPCSPDLRAMSIDGGRRPLRKVLSSRSRKESNSRAAARDSVIQHISHDQAHRLTRSAGPVFLPTEQAIKEHRALYAKPPATTSFPDAVDLDLHHARPSASALADHNEFTQYQPEIECVEMLATLSNSSNINDIASSDSSSVSVRSTATDTTSMQRAPFSYRSQMYRPHSRESLDSTRSSSLASFARPSTADATTPFNPSHRTALSLGSQNALTSVHNAQTFNTCPNGAPGSMPPPVGKPNCKRGHTSRRSLSSLVGNRPWSSFLSSPVLGSSGSHSHHSKRVSGVVISRPMSVTSSTFSSHLSSGASGDDQHTADLTLRASDFERAAAAAAAAAATRARAEGSRVRVDSTRSAYSNSSEPGFTVGVIKNCTNQTRQSSHDGSSWQFSRPTSNPLLFALAPPAAPSSASSHHSYHSHNSFPSHHSSRSFATSGASISPASTSTSIFANNLVHPIPSPSTSSRLTHTSGISSSSALRHESSHLLRRPATGDGPTSPPLASSGSLPSVSLTAPSFALPLVQSSSLENIQDVRIGSIPTVLGSSTTPHPVGAGYRLSASGSCVAHRKRPSFGLAIEPAAHSAFDSIPSPLLHTRRTSSVLNESVVPQRPFSTSSILAARTTQSGNSSNTSCNASARASAATLSSTQPFEPLNDLESETLGEDTPIKPTYGVSNPVSTALPALESAMAAASLEQPVSNRRRSVSVPTDEDDSPPQYMDQTWGRATESSMLSYGESASNSAVEQHHMSRQYLIHSPNEEEGAALTISTASSASSGRLSQASKDIGFGSIAGMVSKVFEHPFDLVKVRLQTQSSDQPARYAGALDCFKQTYVQEGLRGLYRGLSMPVFGATLENACLFFTYNQIQSAIRWFNGEATGVSAAKADAESPLSIPQLAIAAAGAGAVTSVVLTPIELIKCKMQVQMITREQHAPQVSVGAAAARVAQTPLEQTRSLYTSGMRAAASTRSSAQAIKTLDGPLALLRRTIAADGIRGLWLGQTGTLLRETGGGVAWFLAFESCSRYLIARKKALYNRDDVTKKDLGTLELVGSGALAGISYNVVLFPADSVKSTMQTEQEMRAVSNTAATKWKRTGFYETFKKIYRTRGVRGLYAGCGVTCLRSAPSSAIIFLMYNKLEKLSDEYGL